MSETTRPAPGRLPLTLAERVDRACDEFEAAWRAGRAPRIESFLRVATGTARSALLRELLTTELELLRAVGQSPAPDEYAARFPTDSTVVVSVFRATEAHFVEESLTLVAPTSDERRGVPPAADRPASARGGDGSPRVGGLPAVPGYELTGVLGRGGMGVVYAAREVRLNRPCALKMIRAGGLAGPRDTRRFLTEAEIAARLRHPNVVQVYSLGEWDGLPYLELEYLEGGSLAARLDGTPRPAREAAELVETLSRAIEEAHRLGIVHRDLKPANVLLAADGTPKVTDFGLAEALGTDPGLTRTGEIMGTPSYMAPEQAGGGARDAGPAADVYALGVILYELLTGRPPFKGATIAETLDQVRTAEPVPPGRLQPKLARDLETICLKCLQKEPSRRYGSAAALADDLGRFRAGRPILARPVGPSERLWRWCRRNPAIAALALSLALLLTTTAAGTGRAAYQFRLSALRERELARRAGQNLDQARQVVDEMYTQVADTLDDRAGMDSYQRDILEKALRFYEGFALRQSDEPRVRFEAGLAHGRVGKIQSRFGRVDAAEAALGRSRALLEPLVAAHPDVPDYRQALCFTLYSLGELREATGRTTEAEALFSEDAKHTRMLIEARPQVADHRRNHASALGALAILYYRTGRPSQAEETCRQVVATRAGLVADHPGDAADEDRLALGRNNLGEILRDSGRLDDAEREYLEAVHAMERVVAAHPAVARYRDTLATVELNLSNTYLVQGRPWEQVEPSYRKALGIWEALAVEHPNVVEYRNHAAAGHNNLGVAAIAAGRAKEAGDLYRRAIEIREALVASFPSVLEFQADLARSLMNLAEIDQTAGSTRDAEARYTRAAEMLEPLAVAHPDAIEVISALGTTCANQGNLLLRTGKREEGLARLAHAEEVLTGAFRKAPRKPEARSALASLLMTRAEFAMSESRYAEALVDWDRAVEHLDGQATAARARVRRALTLAHLHDPARAAAGALEAVASYDAFPGPARPTLGYTPPAGFFYEAACTLALASADALQENLRPRAERDALAERHATAAIGLLDRARDGGYFQDPGGRANFEGDHDLDPLRPRADFQRLAHDLALPTIP